MSRVAARPLVVGGVLLLAIVVVVVVAERMMGAPRGDVEQLALFLAAGGIGRGRQMVAAFALGAQGIWCGSIWHGTRESDLTDEMKQLLFKAKSGDAVQTRSKTGINELLRD